MEGLTFSEEGHAYHYKGVKVPSVSEIIREMGQGKDWTSTPPFYVERGKAVHLAVNLYLQGTLDEASLDPLIVPYYEQFRVWDKDQPLYEPITERPFYSERLNFAGTPDLICNGVIYDIKCSKKLDRSSTWQYQLQGGAYRTLVTEQWTHDYFPFKILLLTGEGPVVVIDLDASMEAWEHLIKLYHIKMGLT
jgi:hypothetical protein